MADDSGGFAGDFVMKARLYFKATKAAHRERMELKSAAPKQALIETISSPNFYLRKVSYKVKD